MDKLYNHTRYCMEELEKVINSPGEIIELGVAAGVTTFQLAAIAKEHEAKKSIHKTVFAFDTFEGLPYSEEKLNKGERFGKEDDILSFFNNIAAKGFSHTIQPIKGLFEDTLNDSYMGNLQFCFAWVDADLKKSTETAVAYLEPRMAINGVIGFHDYDHPRCPGIRPIVDKLAASPKYEQFRREGVSVFLRRIEW